MNNKNTIDNDLHNVYHNEKIEYSKIINEIKFEYNLAHGHIYIDIENVLTEKDTGLKFENNYFNGLDLFGNINNSTGVGLYWKTGDIKEHFLYISLKLKALNEKKRNSLDSIKEKWGEKIYNSESHAIISMNA